MARIRLAALVRRLRRDVAPDLGACSDADLLARFAATRDNAAFELLVWRHGAMVLSACRRVLGHQQDAEDAFQAAFLVLARKAAAVRSGTAVPAWLHRVAVRIAQRAAGKRRATATLDADPPARATPDAAEQRELRGLLDAEIDRLREPYRRAFVLCYLEGLSNADAARVLGCPVGTIESRLSAARRELRHRLAHQRTELPAGILALLASYPVLASGAVATVTRAGVVAAERGLRAAIGIVSEPVVRLAERGLAMTKTRTWVVAVLGIALVSLAAGVGWANRPIDLPVEPEVAVAPEPAEPAVAPPPTPVGENAAKTEAWPLAKQIRNQGGSLFGIAPNGKSIFLQDANRIYEISLVGKAGKSMATSENKILAAAVSPDGKYLATAEGANGVKLRDATTGRVIEALWPKGELPAQQIEFTSDGAKLIVLCVRTPSASFAGGSEMGGVRPIEQEIQQVTRVSVWDMATRKELGHPAQTDKTKWSVRPIYTLAGHGRFVLKTQAVFEDNAEGQLSIKARRFTITDAVSGAAGKPIEVAATLGPVLSAPLSPDGKTLVLLEHTQNELHFLDSGTGKDRFRVPAFRRPVKAVVFSPDGKLVAAATGIPMAARWGGGDTIAAPSEVVIWDAVTGRERTRLTDKETIRDYSAMAFSPDGSFLVAQTDVSSRLIAIWGHLPAPEPEPVKPVTKAAGGAEAPARFQGLFRDLAGEGVTDSRRIESLFLAALGRFPTDVEARTLVSQLARRDDKTAALRDLLGTLVETTEFKKHAEELGRLAK